MNAFAASDWTFTVYHLLFVIVSVKFLEFVKPFCAVLPEIQKPERKVCQSLTVSTCSVFKAHDDQKKLKSPLVERIRNISGRIHCVK